MKPGPGHPLPDASLLPVAGQVLCGGEGPPPRRVNTGLRKAGRPPAPPGASPSPAVAEDGLPFAPFSSPEPQAAISPTQETLQPAVTRHLLTIAEP